MVIKSKTPLVIVHNYLETFREFLSRSGDDGVVKARRFNGDQALFWKGGNKLVISSAAIDNAQALMERWDYEGVEAASPQQPSQQLSVDILNEPGLLKKMVEFAGDEKIIKMIPYATTTEFLELAETLKMAHGLEVVLPESPDVDDLWVVKYLDSKVGFRTLISQWGLGEAHLPFGFICRDLEQAKDAIGWFGRRGEGCVIKADQGGSGVGNLFLSAEASGSAKMVGEKLAANTFLKDDMFVVEELVQSSGGMSPSLEFCVPVAGMGEPRITYLSNQHFEKSGQFAGVAISRELRKEDWYAGFVAVGMEIASKVQALGYAGIFDLDAIVDDAGRLYLVEINARRTGATYVDEFLRHMLGEDYQESVAAISHNKMPAAGMATLEALEAAIGDGLYPMGGEARGVVVMMTSTLAMGYFGYAAVGRDLEDAEALRMALAKRLGVG